jgi:tripartite-type tricarboxylate transporter receptor subunit TctC
LAEDTFPSRPIHLIVGFTPGSASDITGRVFAKGAGPALGEQIVVENKPGAGSIIAAQYVARAATDGYTLFVPALSTLLNQVINPSSPFDIGRDLVPVALLASLAVVLVVNSEVKVHSVSELVSLCKSKPGQVLYASVGAGSLPHLCAALFAQRTGVELGHVPYSGSPQAVSDLIAGRVTMFFAPATAIIGQIASAKLIALATASSKRPSALPDVPTMAEAGMPDFDTSLWLGLMAPVGTPSPITHKLADAARAAMHVPDAVEALRKQGAYPLDAGPEEFAAFISSEVDRWSAVARTAGLKS